MKITLKILKILMYLFLQNNGWGALSCNNDNTDIYFDFTFPLKVKQLLPKNYESEPTQREILENKLK